MEYVIQNGYVGNSLLLWRKEGHGYTTDLSDAHLFTRAEAEKIVKSCASSHNFQIWPKGYLDLKKEYHVDSQDCRRSEADEFERNHT